ncbi:hypothetical protein AMECASPLE_023839 [Ameca splendens]|uniref:Uncharacterized protein n=1 Tax=Ameca splendens TaxID=208324 RepID=A0ABV0Y4T6_9TELE
MFSDHDEGISFHDLRTKLGYISMRDIRSSLAFLINEGVPTNVPATVDRQCFETPWISLIKYEENVAKNSNSTCNRP